LCSSWSSSCVIDCAPPSHYHGHGRPFVFLVASSWPSPWLSSSSCVPSFTPLGHHCGHPRPLVFLVALLLAIVMAMVLSLCSYLPLLGHRHGPPLVILIASSWPPPWSSSCVLRCAPPTHRCGFSHLFMFLVVLLLAIAVAMVVHLCSWRSSWLFSYVTGCTPPAHCPSPNCPLILLVATLLSLLSLVDILFFNNYN
jgi:hypothetical protein